MRLVRGSRVLLSSAFSALFVVLSAVPTALAQSVSSSVETNVAGAVTTDATALTSTADALSALDALGSASIDFGRDGFGRAAQNRNGIGAVVVDGVFANADPTNSIVAHTLWTDSATNNSGAPITYEFTYLISPAQLRLADFAGASAGMAGAPEASFDLVIRSNGAVVFSSSASMVGGFNGHTFTESGTSLNPVFVPGSTVFGYDFDTAIGTLNLGTFAPGQSVTVEYEMTASLVTAGFELGGRAAVGDPFDLSGTPGFTGTFLADGVVAVEQESVGRVKSRF